MKLFLALLIFTQTALAGLPPTTIQGQAGAKQTTFNFQVPNRQATQTGGVNQLIETGNKNLLVNSGFEHSTYSTGWTTSGTATYSGTTTGSEVLSGLKSFKAVASAQTIDLVQDTTLLASSRVGSQMFYRFSAKNTASGVTACVRANGVKLTGGNNCLTLATDGATRTYELAFLADGTSNGIEIDAASTTGTLIVDEVEISTESSAFIDVAQIGPWISYTPTFTGFGTVTVQNFRYRVVGAAIEIQGRWTSGTVTGVEARISLPSNFTSVSDFTLTNVVGTASRGDTPGAQSFVVLIEPSVQYMTMGQMSSGTVGLTKSLGTQLANNGERFSFQAMIPVQGLSNKITTYSQFAVSDVSVENVFSAKVSAAGVVSGENLDWINGNAGITNTSTYTLNYNASIFSVAPNCTATYAEATDTSAITIFLRASTSSSVAVRTTAGNTGAALARDFEIICTKQGADYKAKNIITGSFSGIEKCADPYECTNVYSAKVASTGTVSEENIDWINGNCTNATPRVCTLRSSLVTTGMNCTVTAVGAGGRISTIITSNSTTFSFQNDPSQYDSHVICQKQGVDFKPKTAVAGTYLDAVTSPGAGKPVLCSAKISSTGVISDQLGGCFASCTNATTPVCTFTTNFWVSGSIPNCWHTSKSAGGPVVGVGNTTTTAYDGVIYSGALATSSGNREYFCTGVQR